MPDGGTAARYCWQHAKRHQRTQTGPQDPSTYIVDATARPGRIVLKPGQSWPATNHQANCVQVTFTAGYGSNVPVILKQAILLLAGSWFENRENDITLRINSIPLGVQAIINQQMYPTAVG